LKDEKINIRGIGIDLVDYVAETQRIAEAAQAGRAYSVSALAVHGMVSGVKIASLAKD